MLREAIIRATYPPGEKLRIDQIGKSFDVSSGAVREALSRLTAEGLVLAQPQRGFVVAPVSRKDLEDLTDVRIDIECRCLRDSIKHGDLDWEGRILSLQHRLRSLKDAINEPESPEALTWHTFHQQFHEELTTYCQNKWWKELRRQLYMQSERYRRLSGPLDTTSRDVSAEHDAIADAALARDADLATRYMRQHLMRTTEVILQSSLPFIDANL